MKLYLYLMILGIGLGNLAYGQRTINGMVTDAKTGQPVGLVNLTPDDGSLGTSTDQDGKFRIIVSHLPVSIRFSHIAYEAKILSINKYPGKPIQVQLEPRVESIREVVIEGGKYIQLLRRENFYVSDFEFDQDIIWVAGYANKSILKPKLIALDLSGSILGKQPLERMMKLYKDAFGRVYLHDKQSITELNFKDGQVSLGTPKTFTGWEQNLFDLQMVLGKSGIFKWVYNNGLFCEYARVDFRDTLVTIIHKAYDRARFAGEGPARTFRHSSIPDIPSAPWGGGYDPNANVPFINRAFEQIDYRPVITHIYRFRNSFLIFEDRGCHLWKYDISFLDPADLRIAEPKNAMNTDLLQDPVTGNLFLIYMINSNGFIAGIDPVNGTIQYTMKLENFISGDLLKIYNNRAWFTHQNVSGPALMNLFSTEIGGN